MPVILITGVENSGKTTLAQQLAKAISAYYLPEYARSYLTNLNRPYQYSDIVTIGLRQYAQLLDAQAQHHWVVVDTSFWVLQIWSEERFGAVHPWIAHGAQSQRYDIVLLPHWDIPYEPDPLRESEKQRPYLYRRYKTILENNRILYHDVRGDAAQRLQQAVSIVKSLQR